MERLNWSNEIYENNADESTLPRMSPRGPCVENVVCVIFIIPQVLTRIINHKTFCKMRIKFFAENKKKSQIIFECVENTNSAHQGKEFIVINLNTDNEEMNFKHGLVADYLHHLAEHDCSTDWKTLDTAIAGVMNSKVHFI